MDALYNRMPDRIRRLPEIAYNLWWSWNPDARDLLKRLDLPLWKRTEHNPVRILQEIEQENLEAAARSTLFIRHYDKVVMDLDRELANGHSWYRQEYSDLGGQSIAYFSAEFGIHNSLPIYSGGLGILSGDHAKEASDLGIPLVGVGFMYPQGYFRQQVPSHGWQEAVYEQLDLGKAPIRPVLASDGQELTISVRMSDRPVHARVWHVQVGRVPLYLLDTDVDENDPWDRELSARLYSGDIELRIRQEIMLGIGGVRALRSLGIHPDFWHINEGHSAFLSLECIRELVAEGKSFDEAVTEFKKRSLFTTHTPVPAGHDAFTFHVMETYFAGYWDDLGLSREQFFDLGKHEEEWGTSFNMTVLALRLNGRANGVSKLHGEVSREMWQGVWPEKSLEETPITHITNGIHVPTWAPSEFHQLLGKYLGPDWVEHHDSPTLWERVSEIPDEELWEHHTNLKRKLIGYLRERARRRWVAGRVDPTQIVTSGTILDPEALTIGFARRFATYKRATLIFRDIERLRNILLDTHRPVQLLFAGKAHPADDPGKMLIQNVYNLAKHNKMGGRVAFVED